MKRVIDGKLYDTDTAEQIHYYSSGHGAGDFKNYDEGLYKTSKGAFFLAGEGGPMTRYATPVPTGGMGGGSGIHVLTVEEAREWCESHEVPVGVIQEHFEIDEA